MSIEPWKFTFASHLTFYELLDEGLVRVGAGLLIGGHKCHLLEADHGTREQTENTQVPLEEAKNLIAEDELDECNSDHDVHIIAELSGSWVFFKVEQEGGALIGGCHGSSGSGGVVRGWSIRGITLLRVCLS